MLGDSPYTPDELAKLAYHHVSVKWSGVDPQTQDELAAEFVATAWLAQQRVHPGESGRSFVWKTGAGSVKNHYRRTKVLREHSSPDDLLTQRAAPQDEDSGELTEQRLASLHTFLRLLHTRDRELIERVYGIGCDRETMTVLAADRGVSVPAISQRLSMLRERLRTLVEEDVG